LFKVGFIGFYFLNLNCQALNNPPKLFEQFYEMKKLIEKFHVKGNVYLWKYKENQRNYPGWNLTVDNIASESITQLLDLMQRCEWSSSKLIILSRPTNDQIRVPNNWNGTASWKWAENLVLSSIKTDGFNHWKIYEKYPKLEIAFGSSKLEELKSAVTGIPHGKGDFSIETENDDDILNFWWNLAK
jgi:hypothetical protein